MSLDQPVWLSLTSACEVFLHFLFNLVFNGNLLFAFRKVIIVLAADLNFLNIYISDLKVPLII